MLSCYRIQESHSTRGFYLCVSFASCTPHAGGIGSTRRTAHTRERSWFTSTCAAWWKLPVLWRKAAAHTHTHAHSREVLVYKHVRRTAEHATLVVQQVRKLSPALAPAPRRLQHHASNYFRGTSTALHKEFRREPLFSVQAPRRVATQSTRNKESKLQFKHTKTRTYQTRRGWWHEAKQLHAQE
jgi:hypothetical protein